MTEGEHALARMELTVEGIGGIDSTSVTLQGGVNVLEGRNATNRTSLLQAIIAGLGGNAVSLNGNRDEGCVELVIDGESYTRNLAREDGRVRFSGEPYLSNSTEADLFAFLLETNEARQAVSSGADLRDVIMRPVDTAGIDRQIRELQSERTEIDTQIETLEQERTELPALEEHRRELESKLSEEREKLSSAKADLEDANQNRESEAKSSEAFEATLDDLKEARAEREEVSYDLETDREALASARDELTEKSAEREEIGEVSDEQVTDIEERIAEHRRRKRLLDTRISKLHRIVQFNEEILEGDSTLGNLLEEGRETEVTAELAGDTDTTCWTCGSQVGTGEIDEMLEQLRELSQSQRQERNELESELENLTDRRDELERERERRAELSDQIDSLEADIERRERRIEDLESRKGDMQERIDELEEKAEELEQQTDSRVPELQQKIHEHTLAVERLEREYNQAVDQIETLEAKGDEIDALERNREQISDQLSELRTRIDQLEEDSVEAFNHHIAELIDLLEYENIARVWIERKQESTGSSATEQTTFELHVVRTTDDGVTYEDTVDHLSESEREIVGIVFALAGYLVHEVYETVPIMLLDSLEAIDSQRIALLVDYLTDYAPTIVAALLPEDAEPLEDDYARIRDI